MAGGDTRLAGSESGAEVLPAAPLDTDHPCFVLNVSRSSAELRRGRLLAAPARGEGVCSRSVSWDGDVPNPVPIPVPSPGLLRWGIRGSAGTGSP